MNTEQNANREIELLERRIRDLESELKAGAHMLAKMHDKNHDLEAEIKLLKSELVSMTMRYEEETMCTMDCCK